MKNKWPMLGVLYLCAITIALGQLKIVPVMELVQAQLGITATQAGWLVSIFTLAGIAMAVPGAAVLKRLGAKNLLLLLMLLLCAGNVMGAMATGFIPLMAGRVIEGVAFSMILLAGLSMVNVWFADGAASTATGIFTTFTALGSFVMMNAAYPVVELLGLNALWWMVALLAAACFVLALLFIRMPPAGGPAEKGASLLEAVKNKKLWLLAACHFCISFLLFAFITTYPQLFTGFYGLAPTTANFYAGLYGLFGIPPCILCGMVIDKTGKPHLAAIAGCLLTILSCLLCVHLSAATYIPHILLTSISIGGLGLTANLCLAPGIAKAPAAIGYTMAIVNLAYYIGAFVCTPVVMGAVEASGWPLASGILVGVGVVALVFAVLLALVSRRPAQSPAPPAGGSPQARA